METEALTRMLSDAARDEEVRREFLDTAERRPDPALAQRIPGGNVLSDAEYDALLARRLSADDEHRLYEDRRAALVHQLATSQRKNHV